MKRSGEFPSQINFNCLSKFNYFIKKTATWVPKFSHEANKIFLMNINKILFYGMDLERFRVGLERRTQRWAGWWNCGDRRVLNLGDEHQTITATGHYHALSCIFWVYLLSANTHPFVCDLEITQQPLVMTWSSSLVLRFEGWDNPNDQCTQGMLSRLQQLLVKLFIWQSASENTKK